MPQRLRFLDASEWQGRPPWAPILALGYFGAIVKAGEHEHEDPSFLFNAAQLDKAGARLRGAYYFGHPGEDPVDAARWFLGTAARRGIKPTTPGTVYVLDLETADGRSPAEVDSWASSFLGELHRLGAHPGRTMLYTDVGFADSRAGSFDLVRRLGVPLWIADVGVPAPRLPRGWERWTAWQFSWTDHPRPGLTADESFLAGTEADVLAWLGYPRHAAPELTHHVPASDLPAGTSVTVRDPAAWSPWYSELLAWLKAHKVKP